jgi:hypothetical protein
MKTRWNGEFLQGLRALTAEEGAAVSGGESLWYWVSWAAGMTVYMLAHPTPNQTAGQKAMNAALG